jgi:hypothetical protein
MAPRRTTRTQPRQKQAATSERLSGAAPPNGESTATASIAKNGVGTTNGNGAWPSFEQVQRRAYELFEGRGGTHGSDWADWFAAEQELTGNSTATH